MGGWGCYQCGAESSKVTAPRGEEGKQSVAGMRGVPDDAACLPQTSLVLDSLNGRERSTSEMLTSHYLLQSFLVC